MEEKNHIYKLIQLGYLQELDNRRKEELENWLRSSPDHISEYEDIIKVLRYADRLTSMAKIDTAGDLLLVKQKMKSGSQLRKLSVYFQRIAALLIIPLLLFSVWTMFNRFGFGKHEVVMNRTETSYGVRSQIQLSDGTKVWLNSGSKLFYPEKFNGKSREVRLIGEAYFQVKSDREHPFYVDLDGYKIKATGTSFNISNYTSDNEVIAYLEHGKVALVGGQKEKETEYSQLEEGEMIILNKAQKQYRIQKADGSKYLSWVNGKLVFKKDNIRDVAVRLGRWFNVELVVNDERLNDYIFTATFEKESLEEALILLSYSSPIKYKIIPGHQLNDSSYYNRKVIISKMEKAK